MSSKLKPDDQPSALYVYNKGFTPFPEPVSEKAKPPLTDLDLSDNSELFAKKKLTPEQQAAFSSTTSTTATGRAGKVPREVREQRLFLPSNAKQHQY